MAACAGEISSEMLSVPAGYKQERYDVISAKKLSLQGGYMKVCYDEISIEKLNVLGGYMKVCYDEISTEKLKVLGDYMKVCYDVISAGKLKVLGDYMKVCYDVISAGKLGLPMARHGKALMIAAVAMAGVCRLWQPSLVPPPDRRAAVVAVPAEAAACAAAPAFADAIGHAANRPAEEAYPFVREVNWNSYMYLTKPGTATAGDWAKAVDKAIVMGASMDSDPRKARVQAHHKAIGAVSEANSVMSKVDLEDINVAIDRMIASVTESQTMDVCNAFCTLVPAEAPQYLISTENEADAKRAYSALMQFKDVVKATPSTPQGKETPAALSGKLGTIEAAVAKLFAASYPFIKSAPWDSNVYLKSLTDTSLNQAMKTFDKAPDMGASMDGKLLKESAMAHHNALGSMDGNIVTTVIASVPSSQAMDVSNAFSKITGSSVPINVFSMISPPEASAAYDALLKSMDVVKAAQR